MKEFDKIFVSWRTGTGSGRHIIGELEKRDGGKFTFKYDKAAVSLASKEGFSSYTELPNIDLIYNGNVLDVFAQRLIKSVRPDVQDFYDFWEIEPDKTEDKYYLLAHTQGLLPTDNFELLADFNPVIGLHFLTDLAHITESKLPKDTVKKGDELTFKTDPLNAHDKKAVKVFKGAKEIGFIKKGHSHLFYKTGSEKIKLSVKSVDQDGFIKRIFVKVFIP